MMKAIFVFLVFILLSDAGYATSVSINANLGASKVGDTLRVYAIYYSNTSQTITNADCIMSGGFLVTPISLSYNSTNSNYQYDLYLSSAGAYVFSISCTKSGYETAAGAFTINVPKGDSTMSLNGIPGSTEVGSAFSVQAQYQNKYIKISNAVCLLNTKSPIGSSDQIHMYENGAYYEAKYVVSSPGTYSFTVSCSSDKYNSQDQSFTIFASKRKSLLSSQNAQNNYYADRPVTATYNYLAGNGQPITNAKCNYELHRSGLLIDSGILSLVSGSYALSMGRATPSEQRYDLKVSCESPEYILQSVENSFYVREIPTYVTLIKETPNGAYSFAPLSITAEYVSSNTNSKIAAPACTISTMNEKMNITAGKQFETFFPAVEREINAGIEVCCSKKNYLPSCGTASLNIRPQPISIESLPVPSEYIMGEKYLVGVRAAPAFYGKSENIACRFYARSEGVDAPSKFTELRKNNAAYTTELSFERAGYWELSYLCSSPGFQQQQHNTRVKVKVFNKERESTLVTIFGALGVIMLAALIIIRRKYKV